MSVSMLRCACERCLCEVQESRLCVVARVFVLTPVPRGTPTMSPVMAVGPVAALVLIEQFS